MQARRGHESTRSDADSSSTPAEASGNTDSTAGGAASRISEPERLGDQTDSSGTRRALPTTREILKMHQNTSETLKITGKHLTYLVEA